MRSGKLAHVITIVEKKMIGVKRGGTPIHEEVIKAKLRAEIVQQSTEEFIRDYGASDETIMIFRTRYLEGVKNSDVIKFKGRTYNIKEVTEIGRRIGLEIRCIEVH